MKKNPWVLPFERLLEDPNLAAKMTVKLSAIQGLQDVPSETACNLLREHLKKLFIPDPQGVSWIRRALGMCHAHALAHYSSEEDFAERVHSPELSLSGDPVTRFTTSEAGWGKTQLAWALMRLLASNSLIQVGHSILPRRVVGVVRLQVDDKTSRAAIMNALAAAAGYPEDYKSSAVEELASLRKQLYLAGVMLILVDELQFMAQSSASNLIVKTLHFLRSIGIPVVFIGNYSLGHKLLRRPQEDQHRLLSQPDVLLSEDWESESFESYLQGLVDAMGDQLAIKPRDDAKLLHWYSGGNRRTVRELVVLAYFQVRETAKARGSTKVHLNDLTAAYSSRDFSTRRGEVELCRKLLIDSKRPKTRIDLWCPFSLPPELEEHRAKLTKSLMQTETSNAALQASATPDEIAGMKVMQEVFDTPDVGARVNPPVRASRRKVTMEDMLASKPAGYQ